MMVMVLPGNAARIRTIAETLSVILKPSIDLITEPTGMPAFSAPSPALNLIIFAPIPV